MLDRPTHPGRELFTSSLVALAGAYGIVTTLRRMRATGPPLLTMDVPAAEYAAAPRRRTGPGRPTPRSAA